MSEQHQHVRRTLITAWPTFVGTLDAGEYLPVGELFVSRPFTDVTGHTRASLIVKLASPTFAGENSYEALAKVDCATHVTSVVSSGTYSTQDATGAQVFFQAHVPEVVIDNPSAVVMFAVRVICEN